MRVPAVAIGGTQSSATIAVHGQGTFGEAVAALLAARGNHVRCLGVESKQSRRCDIWTVGRAHYTLGFDIEPAVGAAAVKSADAVVVAARATEYGGVFEDLAPHLNSGQTIFIVGACFGASMEAGRLLQERRSDLAVNIVETSQPFASCELSARSIAIKGVRDSILIAGRTLNETRAGLSAGNNVFNGLVPASTILERGFFDADRWLETAALLFTVFKSAQGGSVNDVLVGVRNEISQLAKAYGINRVPDYPLPATDFSNISEVLKDELAERIIEDYIILSSLARLKYVPMPLVDSIIELSSVVCGADLRKEGRQLSDLGMIGMDAQEIIEFVSA